MGNSMTVSKPYIIDDYPSEDDGDDEDDDDDFSYETAHEAIGSQKDSEDVEDLPEAQQGTRQSDTGHEEEEETIQLITEDLQVLRSEKAVESSATLIGSELSEEEFLALAKLDEDLSQFEEDESKIINTQNEGQFPKREKSSIPTFRSAANKSVKEAEEEPNSSQVAEQKAFVPTFQKETSRARVSAIPRFFTSSSVEEKSTGQSLSEGEDLAADLSKIVENELREENQEIVEANGQDVAPAGPSASSVAGLEQDDEELTPVSREVKVIIESQNSEDDLIKVTDTSAWEINISDFTGRAKRNKKRSGIPSLWTDAGGKTTTKSYPDSKPISPSTTTSSPSSPEAATTSPSRSPKIPDFDTADITPSSVPEVSSPGQRKVFDLKRWMCISRPQYKTSCGMSSVVSCWNLLFSTLGHGSLAPLSQEEAMKILGFKGPYEKLRFGPFTGNLTLLRWFRELTNHFKIRGRCHIMFKPNGRNRTIGVTDKMALDKLKAGLQDPNTAFIYHCHNHYFCPVGYEESPQSPKEAYIGKLAAESVEHTWILIGDTSRKYGPFHCKRWEQICQDLHLNNPEYINIRKSWQGVLKRKTRKTSGNLHCIMCFQKPKDLQSFIPTTGNSQTRSSIPRSRLPRRSPSPSSRRSVDGEFRFSGDSRDGDSDDDREEGVENLTSDVSSDEDVRGRRV